MVLTEFIMVLTEFIMVLTEIIMVLSNDRIKNNIGKIFF